MTVSHPVAGSMLADLDMFSEAWLANGGLMSCRDAESKIHGLPANNFSGEIDFGFSTSTSTLESTIVAAACYCLLVTSEEMCISRAEYLEDGPGLSDSQAIPLCS
jgi:hypothetical protein